MAKESKINPEEVAEFIGADVSTRLKQTKKGRRYVEIVFCKTGRKKRVYQLTSFSLKEYNILGKAKGMDILYCFFLGVKYCRDFLNRVYGFHVEQEKDLNFIERDLIVCFYEKCFYEKKK